MAFVKLDCGILDSTLWIDRPARDIFVTALLMAQPHELRDPVKQINVRDLTETGFVVPEGWYGFIAAAGIGIINRAGLDQEEGLTALERLGAPDAESRSPEFEGRRLIRIDGGYLALNFTKYREKDATAAERSKRWRERQKKKAQQEASRVSETPSRVIRHQAEAEAEAEEKKNKTSAKADSPHQDLIRRWCVSYEVQHGEKYHFTGRDAKAVKELLGSFTADIILEVAKAAWILKDEFHRQKTLQLHSFAANFNLLRDASKKLKVHRRPAPIISGAAADPFPSTIEGEFK